MGGLLDLNRPAPVIGLSDRELGMVVDALRRRRVDLELDRLRFDRNDLPRQRDTAAQQLQEVDLLRVWGKLGDVMVTEPGVAPEGDDAR